MQRSLDHRMPVTDLRVTTAMLDPSQRNLSAVQKFLAARSLTAVDLLTEFLGRYVSDAEELQQGTSAALDDRKTPAKLRGKRLKWNC